MEIGIRPAVIEDLPALAELFERYPFKVAQRRVQRLDQARLNAFYHAGLRKGIESGRPHWVAERAGEFVALGGLSPETWHSEIYGLRMAKIAPWMNTTAPAAGTALADLILDHARRDGHEHVSVRFDGEDYPNLHLFESRGFRLIDVSLKFTRPMRGPDPPPMPGGFNVRVATDADAAWMRDLGSRAHAYSHFLNDPVLPAERTHALFDEWVGRCASGLAWRIYLLETKAGDGVGFVTYLRNRAFAGAVGANPLILDYVVLDPAARGGGTGPAFIAETLRRMSDEGFDYCELRTSQHNHAAIGCYEKLGFRLCATDFILHKKL